MSKVSDLIALYTAPNSADNVTVDTAMKFSTLMTSWGMPFDALRAYPSAIGAQTISVTDLVADGVPPSTPLYIAGVNNAGNPEGTGYFIALELAILAQTPGDSANGFAKLYEERHPGASLADAMLYAQQLPAVIALVPQALQMLRVAAGV